MTAELAAGVDNAAPARPDERARQRFISKIRKMVLVDLAEEMRRTYVEEIAPACERKSGAPPQDAAAIRRLMAAAPIYQFYSSSRYKVQEMVWESVRPQVERNLDALMQATRRKEGGGGGSLRLDHRVTTPRYVSELDVHLMPGSFHSEFQEDDVAQGAVYSYGVSVFYGGLPMVAKGGGPAATIAHFLRAAYPEFEPAKILDCGCTTGGNTFPYTDVFPSAEIHGVDVSAPLLRYANARAAAAGKTVHFSQQNAEKLDFPDASFDLVTSSFFLHEIPVESTKAVFAECYRILKPGGLMIHFELPPRSEVDPYMDFYLDWDAYYNNEPYYSSFRRQSLIGLCVGAGFDRNRYIQRQLPNWGTMALADFQACARGEIQMPIVLNGASWFTFGAWK